MNFPRTLALAAAALLTLPAISAAQDVQFYQKASEAHAPITGNVAMRLTLSPEGETSNVRDSQQRLSSHRQSRRGLDERPNYAPRIHQWRSERIQLCERN